MNNMNFIDNYQSAYTSDAVYEYYNEITSRIVAETGKLTDRFHIGKILLQCLKDDPDFIVQIDGATGQSESNRSVLERSVRCATAFTKFGIQLGDVVTIIAPNHLDLVIPFYACHYLGAIASATDRTSTINQLVGTFVRVRPKLLICQMERAQDVQKAVEEAKIETQIITFDEGDEYMTFSEFLIKYGKDGPVGEFKATDFDPAVTVAHLVSTSGTTGCPMSAAITHKNLTIGGQQSRAGFTKFPTPISMALNIAPLQWLSATVILVTAPIMKFTCLQTSSSLTVDHFNYLLQTYQPSFLIISPILMASMIKTSSNDVKNITCLEHIWLGGSPASRQFLQQLNEITPETRIGVAYGLSEVSTVAFHVVGSPLGSVGRPLPCFKYRLINVETHEDINEPNICGELWLKSLTVFMGYYNNPEATAEVITADGWLKTGDIFYRDENWNFFFKERVKMLFRSKENQMISPTEIENVIRGHPGVLEVAVGGRRYLDKDDVPVACVMRRPGYNTEAQEIMDIVKENLTSNAKQLDEVIFMDELPLMATGKLNRLKINLIINNNKMEVS